MFYRKCPRIFTLILLSLSLFIGLLIGCQKPPVPEVHAVDPSAAKNGDEVTLHGIHLTYFNEIRIGDFVMDYSYVIANEHTNEKLVFKVPPGLPPGPELIYLTHDRGETEGILIDLLGPGPTLSRIATDTLRVGELLHLEGQYLAGAGAEVHLNDLIVTELVNQTDSTIQLIVPQEVDRGGVSVFVNINGCASNTENIVILDPLPDNPEITAISPNPAAVGDTLTITGHYFRPGNMLVILPNDLEIQSFVEQDSNRIQLIVPPRVKAGTIELSTDAEQSTQFPGFTLLPKLISLSESFGKPGDEITLSGWNFENFSEVRFGNNTLPGVNLRPPLSDTTVQVIIPDLPPNTYPISLYTQTGGSETLPFVIQDACNDLEPAIASVATPPFRPGNELTISGTNFLEGAIVRSKKQGLNLELINRVNEQTLVVKIPENINCGVDSLSIITSCGSSAPFAITIDKTPVLQPIATANLMPGTTISLSGTYLKDATVRIGNQSVSPAENSDNALTFELPEDFPPGDYQLMVITACGTSNALNITVEDPVFSPEVSGISQDCKVMGDTLTIFGNHFPAMPQVKFNDAPGTVIESTPTRLVVMIPSSFFGDIDGIGIPITVEDPETGLENMDKPYVKLFHRPSIAGFLPLANAPGGPLFLRGEHLNAVQQIHFGGSASLRRSAGEFIFSEQFQELGMNLPVNLNPGEVEICFDIAKSGCTIENICQELLFTVTDKTSQHATPSPGNPFTIAFPNPPPGISLPGVSNNWRVMFYQNGESATEDRNLNLAVFDTTKDCEESNGEEQYKFVNSNDEADAGTFQQNGHLLSFTYNGKLYEGRQHYDSTLVRTTEYDNYNPDCPDARYPFHLIFTPVEEGDQIELIFPFIIDEVTPPVAESGSILTLFGRGLTEVERAVLVNQETKQRYDVFDIVPDSGSTDNPDLQAITLPGDLGKGKYDLFLIEGLQNYPSNVVTFEVPE